MPTFLGSPFPPTFSGWPPRMSSEDFDLWQRWWPALQPKPLRVYFDVGVGLPENLPATDDVAQLSGWIRNNQKRIDALLEFSDKVWIVELRFNASLNAVGRLLGYGDLWQEDPPIRGTTELVLVTNRDDAEVQRSARKRGIVFVLV